MIRQEIRLAWQVQKAVQISFGTLNHYDFENSLLVDVFLSY